MLWFEGFVSDCISMVVEVHWNLRCKSESAVVGSAEYVLVGVVNYSNLKYSCWVTPQSPDPFCVYSNKKMAEHWEITHKWSSSLSLTLSCLLFFSFLSLSFFFLSLNVTLLFQIRYDVAFLLWAYYLGH